MNVFLGVVRVTSLLQGGHSFALLVEDVFVKPIRTKASILNKVATTRLQVCSIPTKTYEVSIDWDFLHSPLIKQYLLSIVVFSLDCQLFKKLYITFVRPHLEYAHAVWAPHLSKYTNMIENVRIRTTKLVDGLGGLDYTKRLKKLDLPTLAYRRARGDMIELFKHFHAYDKATLPLSFQPRNRISRKPKFQLVWKLPKDGTRGLQANSFLLPHHTNMEQLTTGSSKRWKYQLVQEHAEQNLDEQPIKIRSHNTIERFEEAHSLPVNLYFLIIIIIIITATSHI